MRRLLATPARRNAVAAAAALIAIAALLLVRNLVTDRPLDRLRRVGVTGDRTTYEGSWYFPRGGPYKVGFESPGGAARLWIDGIPIRPRGGDVDRDSDRLVVREPWRGAADPDAPRGDRLPYHRGVVGVRFEAPAGARLLWVPPGRRSDPEYVPPSSLSPDPPATARFGGGAGASRGDGLFALAIAAVLIGLGVYLAREPLRRADRRVLLAAGGVLVLALALRLWGLGDAGDTWDENTNWSAGRNYLVNWLSLDFSPASWRWNYEHPPVMKYLAGVGALLADGFGPARALSALVMALACALLVPIGARLFSLRVGVLAGVLAALTPHLVGHGQIIGHEAPSVLLWTLSVWLALGLHDRLDHADRRRLIVRLVVLGAVIGLAFWSRFANALVAPLIAVIVLATAPAGRRRRTAAYAAVVLPLAALAIGFLIWPRLWSHPIDHLAEAWDKLKKPHTPEAYLGDITAAPPRSYFLVYLYATAPLGLLITAAAGLARTAVRRRRAELLVLAWLGAPLLVLLSPVRQDGVRYILPALMALALLAAAGVDFAIDLAARSRPGWRRPAWAGAGVVLAGYLAVVCLRIRPYYLDYYGEQAGGPAAVAADRRYEIAWWGEGMADALAYIDREAEPGARVYRCVSPYDHLAWLRDDLWEAPPSPAAADWVLVYQPGLRGTSAAPACPLPPGFSLVHEVRAQGAPLARVYRRGSATPAPPRSPAAAPPTPR